MRWLHHVRLAGAPGPGRGGRYAPDSLATDGFVHASYRDAVLESARLYFPAGASLEVMVIDPRLLDVPVVVATTPRGGMPHIHGAVAGAAIAQVLPLAAFEAARASLPDTIDD